MPACLAHRRADGPWCDDIAAARMSMAVLHSVEEGG